MGLGDRLGGQVLVGQMQVDELQDPGPRRCRASGAAVAPRPSRSVARVASTFTAFQASSSPTGGRDEEAVSASSDRNGDSRLPAGTHGVPVSASRATSAASSPSDYSYRRERLIRKRSGKSSITDRWRRRSRCRPARGRRPRAAAERARRSPPRRCAPHLVRPPRPLCLRRGTRRCPGRPTGVPAGSGRAGPPRATAPGAVPNDDVEAHGHAAPTVSPVSSVSPRSVRMVLKLDVIRRCPSESCRTVERSDNAEWDGQSTPLGA